MHLMSEGDWNLSDKSIQYLVLSIKTGTFILVIIFNLVALKIK